MSRSSSRSTTVGTPIEDSGTEHVLIVEDNLINQTVLKRQLIKAGLSCNGQFHPIPSLSHSYVISILTLIAVDWYSCE